MSSYQRVLVRDTERFAVRDYPFLDDRLQQIAEQTKHEPPGQTADMLLSFVKEHRLETKLVNAHPQLAVQIHSHSLPIGELEDLFEAGRNNPLFRKELEEHVRNFLRMAAKQ